MTDNHDLIMDILTNIREMGYIKPEELPDISLYMDQVTTFMNEHLAFSKRHEDDKILTKTMINNYAKNHVLPPPDKKKYSKEYMFLLIYVYYFKNFLSISDIQHILTPLMEQFYGPGKEGQMEAIYKEVFRLCNHSMDNLVKSLVKDMKQSSLAFADIGEEKDKQFLTDFSFICLLSFDVYIKKMLIERIIDQHLTPQEEKAPEKKNQGKKAEGKKVEGKKSSKEGSKKEEKPSH